MTPDVGAGAPLTHIWWIALTVLFVCTVASGVATAYVTVSLQKKLQSDESQSKAIGELERNFHQCQVKCATSRGEMVKRDDFEGRMLRQEDILGRIFERVDRTESAVAEIKGFISSELARRPEQ